MDDDALADTIWHARTHGLVMPAPSREDHPLGLAQAYRIQAGVTRRRLAAGERVVGWKLGYTSQVMREQMGIDQPNFGPLTNVMALESPAVGPAFLRQPRVEPEVALTTATEIPAGISDISDLIGHIASARASLEVVDSSWTDYSFDLGDNTADSSSAGAFVLGGPLSLDDPAAVTVRLEVSGEEIQTGRADAAMGNPLLALAWLVEQLGRRGELLPAGSVVLTGGMTRAIPVAVGATARAVFNSALGSTEVVLTRRSNAQVRPVS